MGSMYVINKSSHEGDFKVSNSNSQTTKWLEF